MRSALFTPATSPDRAAKLADLAADAGVIDLEDAVPAERKVEARVAAREVAARVTSASPSFTLFVRVNPVDSAWFDRDIEDGLGERIAGIFLPKVESASDLVRARNALDAVGREECGIVAGLETGKGVLEARSIADSGACVAVYFGAEDYTADIGGTRTPGGLEVLYARSHVALAAAVAGIGALDEIVAEYNDDGRFREDASFGRSLGYTGKLCIHPRQVELANAAFTPSPEEVEFARRVVDAYRAAALKGTGAIGFEGSMIDEPMVTRAKSVLRAAGEER